MFLCLKSIQTRIQEYNKSKQYIREKNTIKTHSCKTAHRTVAMRLSHIIHVWTTVLRT